MMIDGMATYGGLNALYYHNKVRRLPNSHDWLARHLGDSTTIIMIMNKFGIRSLSRSRPYVCTQWCVIRGVLKAPRWCASILQTSLINIS